MPSTERLPSGRYRGLYRDAAGDKQRVPGTFPRKSDAREAAIEAEAKAKRSAAAKAGTLSARTSWGNWWDTLAVDREFPSDTPTTENNIVKNFLRKQWGDASLNKIEHGHVQAWVDQLCRDGRSAGYVRRIYSVFRSSIRIAVDRKVLTADPCSGVVLPKVTKKPKVFLEPADLQALAGRLKQPWRDAIAFMLETGLRPGELGGLHAHRVDLKTGWVTVAEVYVSKKRAMRSWPKDRETRAVPLSDKAVAIIRRQLAGRTLRVSCDVPHLDGGTCTHALVFVHDGRPISAGSLWYQLTEAAVRADTDPKTPYGARRGYATRLAEAGLDAFALADLMGHSDVSITREYVQRTSAAKARVLAALGQAQPLHAVGQHGTDRGTDRDNQPPADAPTQVDEKPA